MSEYDWKIVGQATSSTCSEFSGPGQHIDSDEKIMKVARRGKRTWICLTIQEKCVMTRGMSKGS
jgi:hypothetical protein